MTDTARTTIWTLGHGQRAFDDYVEILADYDIQLVLDVRSKPVTRFTPHFNRDRFCTALTDMGFEYKFFGDVLGGMPGKTDYYDDEGHTLYAPLSRESWFVAALVELERLAGAQTVVMTCLEEEPERCHRHLLLGKTLSDRGADVQHIRHAGYTESQSELDERLGVAPAWFTDSSWRSPMPMKGGHNRA